MKLEMEKSFKNSKPLNFKKNLKNCFAYYLPREQYVQKTMTYRKRLRRVNAMDFTA